jgi:hypothetical protein
MRRRKPKVSKKKTTERVKAENKDILKNAITNSKYFQLNMKVKNILTSYGMDPDKTKFIDNPDEIKMSAVIIKLAQPYIRMYWGNEMRVRGIISLTITIWNMTFLPEKEQTELQETVIEEILPKDCDAQDVATMLRFFENLRDRKRELFSNIRTFIMGHDLRLDSENIHLSVSSVPLNERKPT